MIQDRKNLEPGGDTLETLGLKQAESFEAPDEPMTAGDLLSLLLSGIRSGQIDPNKPVKLEDPQLMHPWDIRGVHQEGDELVLDVWGRP